MDAIIFEPEHRPAHYVVLICSVLPGAIGLVMSAAMGLGREAMVVSALLTFAIPMAVRSRHVRRVVFDKDLIVVRYLLMDRYFKYKEFLKIGSDAVITPRGRIEIGRWLNRVGFLELLRAQRARGVFTDAQFEPEVLDIESTSYAEESHGRTGELPEQRAQ